MTQRLTALPAGYCCGSARRRRNQMIEVRETFAVFLVLRQLALRSDVSSRQDNQQSAQQ